MKAPTVGGTRTGNPVESWTELAGALHGYTRMSERPIMGIGSISWEGGGLVGGRIHALGC